jgi:hypothetical protein
MRRRDATSRWSRHHPTRIELKGGQARLCSTVNSAVIVFELKERFSSVKCLGGSSHTVV